MLFARFVFFFRNLLENAKCIDIKESARRRRAKRGNFFEFLVIFNRCFVFFCIFLYFFVFFAPQARKIFWGEMLPVASRAVIGVRTS